VRAGSFRAMKEYWIYILASRSHRLYIGVTNSLARRLYEHRCGLEGFTARYRIHRLVYFERTTDVRVAIDRETQLKSYRRQKKVALIEAMNPTWDDLGLKLGIVEGRYPRRTADSSLRSE
jgi:putative endonuclease